MVLAVEEVLLHLVVTMVTLMAWGVGAEGVATTETEGVARTVGAEEAQEEVPFVVVVGRAGSLASRSWTTACHRWSGR